MPEIRHKYTDNIVCPHCGHERNPDIAYEDDGGTEKCKKCGKEYSFELLITVECSTEPIYAEGEEPVPTTTEIFKNLLPLPFKEA